MKWINIILSCVIFLFFWGCAVHNQIPVTNEINSARDSYDTGRYSEAVSKFMVISEKYKDPEIKELSQFKIGQSYYQMKSYYDARVELQKYMEQYPKGKYQQEAQKLLEGIKEVYEEKEMTERKKIIAEQDKVKELQKQLEGNYQQANTHFELGNSYWNLGNYTDAVKEYFVAMDMDQTYRDNELIKSRILFDLDGKIIPITPSERVKMEIEKDPIVVFNTNSYSARDRFQASKSIYVITGQVKNRSTKPILNLRIEVTLYNNLSAILETKETFVGNLLPAEIRSFSIRIPNFDDVINVQRFECKPVYSD